MKEGLYYEDIRNGEILKCKTFTRSCYLFEKCNGELIERVKTNHYKRITSKKKIAIFEGNNSEKKIKKPRNRKERVEFLIRKMGFDVIGRSLGSMTDRDVKYLFEGAYLTYKDKEDYQIPEYILPECLVCGSETVIHWDCCCGHAIIDENDTSLQELKDSGEYDEIRKSLNTK
ncbi:TPA: hypothetical protein ACR3Z0_005645 [Bacillus thuringiensis]|uniref:Uncharacterized protein n=2 Tax=Bacillus cereus group TaxID=86661 RepID=A0A9X6KRI4_BACTU|nr:MULTISPECIES: hypothetical protein [Bacillus cereus group]QUW68453.1 hypothetical protein KFQ04_29010 [Pseudomonas synxantha]AQY42559.1 hypothetical protein B4918_32215 [Bacillus thuringiensis]ETE91800.1 hypothetical protein C621_0217010 [Bacillus thuringiensis serovar aizawai str. Leapi01]ETE92058.1 hypothetical protein C623_0226380 [Bacillus thuringiensis serovar aizawai str. Hu4-2]EXY06079.1 hypothetical protein BF15_25230 [Bacillus thuringiensis]